MIDIDPGRNHYPVPDHNRDRNCDHRAFRTAAAPKGIDQSNQQDGGEDGSSHARHYPC